LINYGFVSRTPGRWDEWGFTETLRFIAHNPIFFNPVKKTITIDPLTTPVVPPAEWELPWEFPMWFGETAYFISTASHPALTFSYPGTWLEYPVITIVGPALGLILTNVTTGEFLRFNYAIPAGDTVTVTLDPGNKTVIDNHGTNLAGTLSSDSDFTEFHIACEPEAPLGVNVLTIAVAGTTAASSLKIDYYERYIGI